MAPNTWTTKDQARVKRTLTKIAKKVGGWAAFARVLGLKSRSIPQNWHDRGRVPIAQVSAVIGLGYVKNLRPGDLSPEARHLEN